MSQKTSIKIAEEQQGKAAEDVKSLTDFHRHPTRKTQCSETSGRDCLAQMAYAPVPACSHVYCRGGAKLRSPHLNENAKRAAAAAKLIIHKRRAKNFYTVMQESGKNEDDDTAVLAFDYMKNALLPFIPVQENLEPQTFRGDPLNFELRSPNCDPLHSNSGLQAPQLRTQHKSRSGLEAGSTATQDWLLAVHWLSLPSKETLRGHSDSSFRGEGYIQCCVGVRLCDMYSNQELAEIHFMYGKALARRLYQKRYPQRQCPDRKTFVRLHYRLCEYGKFNSLGLGRGRPRSTTPEVQEEILEAVNITPSISARRFCQWFLQQCGVNPNFPALVLFTDEAQFTRDGITHFHNQHVWAYENPRASVPPSHHQVRFSLNMWAGIIGDRLVGPHVLVNRLTGQAYTNFLENTIPHVLEDTPLINRQHIHFLHDGAPAHFSRTARRYLDRRFPDRWLGRGGPIAWPPRSPDLNPLDFYLWGHLK
ncbi:hypothetical protein ANN_06489 [Periplaneta americana]|uniref:Uncharacterized protein n=1 Tax=Periplaneta americana TaxID=6978 RepID=A0ABQ8TG17_PERAM|nr:hypothetical protein ANN_06489 [Periplaneta americana]